MNDNEKIVNSIKEKIPFTPIDDRILVKPLKAVKVKRQFTVPVDDAGKLINDEDIDHTKQYKTKRVTRSVDSNMSKGIVLKVGKTGSVTNIPFREGHTIVFPTNAGMPFELFKDTRLLKRYEIMGLWDENLEA